MKELLPLFGILTVLNTPFKEDGSVDFESLAANVEYAIEAGVTGILYPAMASEVDCLTELERFSGLATIIDVNNKKVRIIGGSYGDSKDRRVRMIDKLIDIGVDGVLVNIPFRDEVSFIDELREIDRMKPPFLMIQDWDEKGYGIPLRVIKRAFDEIDCFRALKIEVIPSGPKYTEVINITGGLLNVSGGWAVMQLIEALDRGVHCFMPTGLHEIYVKIYNLYRNGKREYARELFYKLLPVVCFSNQRLDISIRFFKMLIYSQGIFRTSLVRVKSNDFDEFQQKIAFELIEYAKVLIEQAKKIKP